MRLDKIAFLTHEEAPVQIYRENFKQVVTITAHINGKDQAGISQRVYSELNQLELPKGVDRNLGGVSDSISKSFHQMFIAMFVSILAVYLIMVITFGNASSPLAILFSLPLASIGGLLGLIMAGESINVTTLIGFLMLIGIVVTNAIVLVDRVEQLKIEGLSIKESLIEASMSRIRPILMTAGVTVIALVPLAIGFSGGTVMSKGLAVVVIGGLISSTLLTLIVVPAAYLLISRINGSTKIRTNVERSLQVGKVEGK